MAWQGATEHDRFFTIAIELVDELESLPERLLHGDVTNMQHGEFAGRARSLAYHLRGAIYLTQADLYAPALAILRTSLEHILIDQLVFLGRRYVQVINGVDEATWANWQEERLTGNSFEKVVDWVRSKKGVVEITFEGVKASSGDIFLSIYYFLLQQYQPYFGPPSAQTRFDSGLRDLDHDRQFAKQNEEVYRNYLSWRSIKKSLKANDFMNDSDIDKLEVHYRFLSAFTHPVSDTTGLIYGRKYRQAHPYDHYSSELILLYAIIFAVKELRHFYQMSTREPTVGVRDWDSTEERCKYAWAATSHLWFPGQHPDVYDRITEANQRIFRTYKEGKRAEESVVNPQEIPETEVTYYRDPLKRLVKMHSTSQEMITGLIYVSPWPRSDAQLR